MVQSRLALFGSFARDEARPDSDVDFLVELDRRTFDRYMELKIFLEDLLQRPVDLVPADRLKPQAVQRVQAYTAGMTKEKFVTDRRTAGMRDMISHAYFEIDPEIV